MRFAAKTSTFKICPTGRFFSRTCFSGGETQLPGVASPNVRLGQTVSITMSGNPAEVKVVSPNGSHRNSSERSPSRYSCDRIGQYTSTRRTRSIPSAATTLSRDESDLGDSRTGHWGSWNRSSIYEDRRTKLGGSFFLLAIALLAAHAAIVFRTTKEADA